MKKIKIIIFILFLTGIQSCQKSDLIGPENNFKYPLNPGNKWLCSYSLTFSNITPDSIKYLLTDTNYNLEISVTKDTLLDSIHIYEIKEKSNDNSWTVYGYYSNETGGFMKHGFIGGSQSLPKVNAGFRFQFGGKYYRNVEKIVREFEELNSPLSIEDDSIYLIKPPLKVYAYPLSVGQEWELKQP